MPLNLKVPMSKLPAEKTLNIIKNATGKPMYKVKNFYESMDTKEAEKINIGLKRNTLTKVQIKKLIRDSKKEGLYMNQTELREGFERAEKEEKQRKIKYSKGRAKLSARLERIKTGEEGAKFRDFDDKRRKRFSSEERKKARSEKVQEAITGTSHSSNIKKDDGAKDKDNTDTKKTKPEPLDLQID